MAVGPPPTSPAVTAMMRGNRKRDTLPELRLRSALHRLGVRFRVNHPVKVPGRTVRPDVVFTRQRIAVFVDGCYWHCCPEHGTSPRSNTGYWSAKLARNVERDGEITAAFEAGGWQVVRVWEHEDPVSVAESLADRVRGGNAPPGGAPPRA